MIKNLAIRPKGPSVSDLASEEALKFVFDCPGIEPLRLDPKTLLDNPELVPIPESYETEAAVALALGLAIQIHTPPDGEKNQEAMSDAIAKVLLRLAQVHPEVALRALDSARDASKAGFQAPGHAPGETNLTIQVVVRLCEDAYFKKLIFER